MKRARVTRFKRDTTRPGRTVRRTEIFQRFVRSLRRGISGRPLRSVRRGR